MNAKALLLSYLRQQKELGMPDPVFGDAAKIRTVIAPRPVLHPAAAGSREARGRRTKDPYARLSRLQTAASAAKEHEQICGGPASPVTRGPLTHEEKRAVFTQMYRGRCGKCALAQSRKNFVFGSGNVDAPLMIIGEAPGAEEDEQGLPFVGAAGRLLTVLLEAVALDRKKDVFITNILKCRPPDNRTPDAAEIVSCLPLVQKQIEVIAPRLLLLLGRIAAHALLGTADGIGRLRGRVHDYRGIPAVVTYHPAALLRTAEYRGPAEEDFRTAAGLLKGKE
jgi:uracil-DNA glycosylase family 4